MAVLSLSSIMTFANSGTQVTLMPSSLRYPVASTRAFTAWLTAPAPMAWISACLCSLMMPAIAPATAEVRELAETLMISMVTLQTVTIVLFSATAMLQNGEVLPSHLAKLDGI